MSAERTPTRLIAAVWLAVLWLSPPDGSLADDPPVGAVSPQDIVGTYEGELWTNGAFVHATTTLFLDSKDGLAGTYAFDDAGTTYAGVLVKPRLSPSSEVTFIWQDEFGFGTLTMRFSDDFRQFAGTWSTLEDGAEAFPWYGKRID